MRTTLLVLAVAGLLAACGTPSRCSPTTCATGCCDLSGLCQSGASSGACGRSGAACSTCSLGATCSFGTCVSGSGAGSSGTGGGSSATGGGSSAGGVAGGSSAGGVAGGSTSGGAAAGGSTSGGAAGGGAACLDGCIDGFGSCRRAGTSAQNANLCGRAAAPCEPCFGATPVCSSGTCVSGSGGGSGGGATAGGGAVGGGAGGPCDVATAPTCPTGSECVLNGVSNTAGTCLAGDCSLVAQNCPTGKCVLAGLADGGVRRICGPGGGSLSPGATCTAATSDPCVTGAQCIGASSSATTCRQYCNPTIPCPSGSLCTSLVQFGMAPGGERHLVCTPLTQCNPFTQAPCASNETCVLYAANSPPGCLPAGTATSGASCNGIASCVRGLQCVGSSPPGVCRPFCNPSGSPSCTSGTCTALPGQTMYGTCN